MESHNSENASSSYPVYDSLISAIKELLEERNESLLEVNFEDNKDFCHIPAVETWPTGVVFNDWETPKCRDSDPIFTLDGRIFFNHKSFNCSAIPYSMNLKFGISNYAYIRKFYQAS